MLIKATEQESSQIWNILQAAILRRRAEGSSQWQDGYPNPKVVQNDIEKGVGYAFKSDNEIVGYCAVLESDEPAYAAIEGKWLSDGTFFVIHRLAIAQAHLGKGLANDLLKAVERLALERGIYSIKVDTNFDNGAMIHLFEKHGYHYCGEVLLRGFPRRAYEKRLSNN